MCDDLWVYADVTDDFESGGVMELGVVCFDLICKDDLLW